MIRISSYLTLFHQSHSTLECRLLHLLLIRKFEYPGAQRGVLIRRYTPYRHLELPKGKPISIKSRSCVFCIQLSCYEGEEHKLGILVQLICLPEDCLHPLSIPSFPIRATHIYPKFQTLEWCTKKFKRHSVFSLPTSPTLKSRCFIYFRLYRSRSQSNFPQSRDHTSESRISHKKKSQPLIKLSTKIWRSRFRIAEKGRLEAWSIASCGIIAPQGLMVLYVPILRKKNLLQIKNPGK